MKKEIDTCRLSELFEMLHQTMLAAWYISGIAIAATLWNFQLPSTRIQAFVFSGIFVFYTLTSAGISKLESIRTELQ